MTGETDRVERELWQRYKRDRCSEARDSLYLHHVPWANAIARSIHMRVRAYQVDREDFIQNATIGLLEAISRYDPTRNVAFRSYALPRVRGSVFNGLRSILGDRTAPSEEARLAARLQSVHEGEESAFDGIVGTVIALGIGFLLDETARADGNDHSDSLSYAHNTQMEVRIMHAVAQLPDRLRLIIQSHYFQHVPFQELTVLLGITKGRVSQLHKTAIQKLRASLKDYSE